jgi:hypothetical protein
MLDRQSEIERAIQNDLTADERAVLEHASKVLRDKARGCDLDGWLFIIGKAHNIRIKLARRLAGSPNRNGAKYNRYLHGHMQCDGIDIKDKKMMGNLTAVAWVCDEEHLDRLEILAEARAVMSPGELATLNSPHSARKLVKKLLDKRSGYEPPPKGLSPLAKLAEENTKLRDTNNLLEERLVSAESGSLFNRTDLAKSVVDVVVRSQFSLDKLKQIEDGIREYRLGQAKLPKPPKAK